MEDLKGFLTFDEKEYPFSYSDGILELYPREIVPQSLANLFAPFERGKAIERIELRGTTAGRKSVVFEVSEQYSNQEGFLSFKVYSIFEYDSYRFLYCKEDGKMRRRSTETKIRGIQLSGLDIDIFFPPNRAYSIEFPDDDGCQSMVCIKRTCAKSLGTITWHGVEISFSARYTIKHPNPSTPFLITSEMAATFSIAVDLKFVKDIYFAVYQTFRYLMRRNNVVFDRVEVFDMDEGSRPDIFGCFYDLRLHQEKETDSWVRLRRLSYDCLKEKFADLVKPFLERIIYIEHLPASIDCANKYGPDRMLFDFVAFEREYANLYPESAIRSEQYIEAKASALEVIDELIEKKTGKLKKYLSSFRRGIAAHENSLADRLLVVIDDCKSILDPFLIYELGNGYEIEADGTTPLEDVVSNMNALRNDMAHGNLDIRIDKDHIKGFSLIETALYAMRLKALGIEGRKIQEGIIQVMGFNFSLD